MDSRKRPGCCRLCRSAKIGATDDLGQHVGVVPPRPRKRLILSLPGRETQARSAPERAASSATGSLRKTRARREIRSGGRQRGARPWHPPPGHLLFLHETPPDVPVEQHEVAIERAGKPKTELPESASSVQPRSAHSHPPARGRRGSNSLKPRRQGYGRSICPSLRDGWK